MNADLLARLEVAAARSQSIPDGERGLIRPRLAKSLMRGLSFPDTGCWVWRNLTGAGYGGINLGRKFHLVHRLVYQLLVGPIPIGLTLDHLCRNPACCRPDHLEPVTQRTNTLRGFSRVAKQAAATHCKRGHPFSGENLYRRPDGGRDCNICRRMHQARKNV